ncbi:sugar ABC transporter substrate-binding protein [Rhodanobacter sp. 7MK24]|uniref:sugar ABC transporter substrate-binding protein n=1 Tax=Rhodanobacter sp. 7MK24 TaxID=2775922 RepID=UPI001786F31B|nr:sugar ABC transporter substrate-binding protein [Rhodanobacter sp. 7MK24]MBD8881800.1 sugar ABC transporter substrate-binding protein [Rhodanobacter sp. 7MK24]
MASGRGAWLRWVSITVALCLAGCGPRHGDTLVFWTFGPEGEAVASLLPDFERTHPGIHVEVQQLPLSAAHQKLLTAIAGGTTPDMAQLGNTWLPELVELHALAPLRQHVDATQTVVAPDYFTSIWATNISGGQLYGIPWYVDTRLLFYRSDLLKQAGFDAPPRDWSEWRRMLAALSHPERKVYGILLPTNEYEQLLSLALQQPAPLLRDDDSRGNFESAGFRRALAFYVDTFRLQQAPAVTNVEVGNPWDEFGRGVYAFYFSGPWNVAEFRKRLPASEQGDWATASLPGPDGPGAGLAGGASLVVFRASKHQREAWALVEYLSQPKVQQRFYQLTGDMPPRRSSWNSPLLQNDAAMHAFRDQLERVKPTPAVPEWERIAVMMQQVAARAVAGELTVDQAAAEMDRQADIILAKRRSLLEARQ